MNEEEIDFRNLLPQGNMEQNLYAKKLSRKLKGLEEVGLYPPQFQVTINQRPTATGDLNFELKVANADRQISFHVVTFSGPDS